MDIFTLCLIINIAVSVTDSQEIAGKPVADWLQTCKDNFEQSGDATFGDTLREDGYCEGVQCVHNGSAFGIKAQFCDEVAENKTCVKSLSSFPNCCNQEICYEYTNNTSEANFIIDENEEEAKTSAIPAVLQFIDNGDSLDISGSKELESKEVTSNGVSTSKNVFVIDSDESGSGKQQDSTKPELSKKTKKKIDAERSSTATTDTTTSVKPPVVTESLTASEGAAADIKNGTERKIPYAVSSKISIDQVFDVDHRKSLKNRLYPRLHLKSNRNPKSKYQRDTGSFRQKCENNFLKCLSLFLRYIADDSDHSRRGQLTANGYFHLPKRLNDKSLVAKPIKNGGRKNQPEKKNSIESDLLFSDVAMEEPFSRIPNQGNMFGGRRHLGDEKDEVNEFNAVEYNF